MPEGCDNGNKIYLGFLWKKISLPNSCIKYLLTINQFRFEIENMINNGLTVDDESVLAILFNMKKLIETGVIDGSSIKTVNRSINKLKSVLAENPQKGIENGTPTRSETDRRGT